MTVYEAKQRLLSTTDRIPSMTGNCISEGRLNVDNLLRNVATPLIQAIITTPTQDSVSSREVKIEGIADSSDFTHFTIEVGEGEEPSGDAKIIVE